MLKTIGNILFGKNPDIFDENGNVSHKLPRRKWDAWQNKIKAGPEYNWRNHTGTNAGQKVLKDTPTTPKN